MEELTSHIENKINSLIYDFEKENDKNIVEIAKSISALGAFSDGKFNEVKGDLDEKIDRKIRPKEAVLTAICHLYLAQKHCKDKKFRQAIDQLCEAHQKLGGAEKIKSEQAIAQAELSKRTKNSAIVKHEKINGEARKKVAELLAKPKPSTGWKSISYAAEVIDNEINKLINEGHSEYDTPRNTEEWIRKRYPDLRKIFKENASDEWLKKYKN